MTMPATRATSARPKQTTSNSTEPRIGRPDARLREMRAPTAPRATSATVLEFATPSPSEGDECDANSLDPHDDVSTATRDFDQQPQ